MTPGFTEVLARETSALAAVGDAAGFAQRRRRLVAERDPLASDGRAGPLDSMAS